MIIKIAVVRVYYALVCCRFFYLIVEEWLVAGHFGDVLGEINTKNASLLYVTERSHRVDAFFIFLSYKFLP